MHTILVKLRVLAIKFSNLFLDINQQNLFIYEKKLVQHILASNIACIVIIMVSCNSIVDLRVTDSSTLLSVFCHICFMDKLALILL